VDIEAVSRGQKKKNCNSKLAGRNWTKPTGRTRICSDDIALKIMNYRYTKHQVARGAFPDAQKNDEIYLFKKVSTLKGTYQIRLLTFLASEAGKKLISDVPTYFKSHPSLTRLMKEFPKTRRIEKS
jgi:hypothetical protein